MLILRLLLLLLLQLKPLCQLNHQPRHYYYFLIMKKIVSSQVDNAHSEYCLLMEIHKLSSTHSVHHARHQKQQYSCCCCRLLQITLAALTIIAITTIIAVTFTATTQKDPMRMETQRAYNYSLVHPQALAIVILMRQIMKMLILVIAN